MTPREAKLANAAEAIRTAAHTLDMDWPQSMITDPMTSKVSAEICALRRQDMAALKTGAAIVDAMLLDADGFAVMIDLAAKKPADFKALVVLAQIELHRKPVEQAA